MTKKIITSTSQPKKATIPKALREQVWIQNVGQRFENKCLVEWCQNKMNVFDFHVGHNVPESKGGATTITNLKPICARCNLSMGVTILHRRMDQNGLKKTATCSNDYYDIQNPMVDMLLNSADIKHQMIFRVSVEDALRMW